MWGLDGLIRKPLAHTTSATTIVFGEHVVLVALHAAVPRPRAARALARRARATSLAGDRRRRRRVGDRDDPLHGGALPRRLHHRRSCSRRSSRSSPSSARARARRAAAAAASRGSSSPRSPASGSIDQPHPLAPHGARARRRSPRRSAPPCSGASARCSAATSAGELEFQHVLTRPLRLRADRERARAADRRRVRVLERPRQPLDRSTSRSSPGCSRSALYYYGLQRTPAMLASLAELTFPVDGDRSSASTSSTASSAGRSGSASPITRRRDACCRCGGGASSRTSPMRRAGSAPAASVGSRRGSARHAGGGQPSAPSCAPGSTRTSPRTSAAAAAARSGSTTPFVREWSRKLYEAGYAGLTWPKEYGGAGAPYSFQAIFYEEIAAAQAPPHVGVIGLGMAGPTIIAHGTDEQKARYLAADPLGRGDLVPGLLRAGRRLRPRRRAHARRAARRRLRRQRPEGVVVVRAHRRLLHPRHAERPRRRRATRNLTYLIVDMHAPGVEVRPLRQITGEAEFNEIFFTDVEVPVANRLGEEGEGWQVAMTTLLHERATLGFALTAALDVGVGRLLDDGARARRRRRTAARERIAAEWIELQALRFTNYRALGTYQRTGIPGPEGSAIKLRWSEQNQRLTKLARELLGPDGHPRRRLVAPPAAAQPRQHDRGRHLRGAAQHHRRARARPPEEPLMDFALRRRPARAEDAGARVARGALPARPRLGRAAGRPLEELAELGWLDVAEAGLGFVEEALLLEEMGYALYPGPYLAHVASVRPRRTATRSTASATSRASTRRGLSADVAGDVARDSAAARGDGRRGGRHRAARARPRRRAREDARAVRQADRLVPGRLAPARRHVHRRRARALARVLGRVVRRGGRRAGAARRRGREGVRDRGRRRRVRALDPGARRHRLHVGAPAASLLQARALARGLRHAAGRAARSRSPTRCSASQFRRRRRGRWTV